MKDGKRCKRSRPETLPYCTKKGSHVSTKINPDGTKVALQFTDDNNDLMEEINLLLEHKNKGIWDSASYAILSAFRAGEFIIEGKRVSIEMCVDNAWIC